MKGIKGRENVDRGTIALAFAILIIVIGLSLGLGVKTGVLDLAPIRIYQGVHPSFVAVHNDGLLYTNTDPHDASTCRIGPATMNIDPDHAYKKHPNLLGEVRDVQIIRDLSTYTPQDTYAHIVSAFTGSPQPNSPYKTYTWDVETQDGMTHKYQMDLWLCSLEVNLWVKPDESGSWFGSIEMPGDEVTNNRWEDAEVWMRLEASNEWGNYFQDVNISNVYFGVAYMEIADVTGSLNEDPKMDVYPAGKWMALDVYETLGGAPVGLSAPPSQAKQYQGATLNPDVFRDEWYTKLGLADFGVYGYNALTGGYKSDTVQFKVLIHIFVVGEWKVKPELERDAGEHTPPEQPEIWEKIAANFGRWLENPFNRWKFAVGATVLILAVALIFAPWILISLVQNTKKLGKELTGD